MNALLPVGAILLFFAGKTLQQKLERISITGLHIKPGSISFTEVLLQVTLDVYNPNSSSLDFNFFNGYIYRNGIRLGRFDFNNSKGGAKIAGRGTTPVTFNVRITTAGVVGNLFNILKNIKNQKAVDLTFSIDALLNVGGFDVPVKYSYNLKDAISGVHSVGKPYVKMEFANNAEMENHFKKNCGEQKHYFSKN